MNPGKYRLREFLTHQNLEQVIIPEIQRDYVWSKDNVINLLNSINEDARVQPLFNIAELDKLSPAMREAALRGMQEKQIFSNIGFIYAYHDPEYPNRYFLIDGQQRLTTMFLVLLALSIQEAQQSIFRNSYFVDNVLKLDYKVREEAHDFFINFTEAILRGEDLQCITNSYWYFSDYNSDITIQSILCNYATILNYVCSENCTFNLHYIESNVEFWYFDTNRSQQGEELYIFMNSRGENVQSNEHIKAKLVEHESDADKLRWGIEWENWQHFFWNNRNKNENADRGFNEFLKWIKIINYVLENSESPVSQSVNYIQSIWRTDEVNDKHLSLADIKSYLEGLKVLCESGISSFSKNWLSNVAEQADLIRLLPLLMYVKANPGIELEKISRFARFFSNVPRFENVRKSPANYCIQAIRLTNQFLRDRSIDVVDLLNYSENEGYKSILTDEEKFKLGIYRNFRDSLIRREIEASFWNLEDYPLHNGQIEFVFYCMDISLSMQNVPCFDFEKFKAISESLLSLFKIPFFPDDLLRRALLAQGDYSLLDGNTPKLGGQRWTLINTSEYWRLLTVYENRKILLKSLLERYMEHSGTGLNREAILNRIISEYTTSGTHMNNWLSFFIRYPEVLQYCRSKNFCWISESFENIYLLKESRATDGSYISLNDFLHGKGYI